MDDGMESDGMADGDYDDAMDDGMDDGMEDGMDAPAAAPSGPPAESEEPAAPQSPPATTFQDYERTGFVETSVDAVSTFSLADADRTSYFLALNWARNGYTVEPDSVRAEEWINAFDVQLRAPDRQPLVRHHRRRGAAPARRRPAPRAHRIPRGRRWAPEFRDETPLNVTLVLDASGSMAAGNRVAIARTAAEAIRQSLGPDDRIAVVHFTTAVIDQYTVEHSAPGDGGRRVVHQPARAARHHQRAGRARPRRAARRRAARRERPDAFNYMILMSDGVANVDATDPFAILESAEDGPDSSQPAAAHHHRRRDRELQRLPARAARAARQRLVPLPGRHRRRRVRRSAARTGSRSPRRSRTRRARR